MPRYELKINKVDEKDRRQVNILDITFNAPHLIDATVTTLEVKDIILKKLNLKENDVISILFES